MTTLKKSDMQIEQEAAARQQAQVNQQAQRERDHAAPLSSFEARQRIDRLNEEWIQAKSAERERIDRESANQRAVEEAEQQLATLRRQELHARVSEAIGANHRHIAEKNTPAVHALLKALAEFEAGKTPFEAVRAAAQALDATFHYQRRIAADGLQTANQIANHTYVDNPLLSIDVNARAAANASGQYVDRFEGALNTHHALMLYVSQARDADDTRRRQGFTFALIGMFVQTGANPASLSSLQDQSRREWLTSLRGGR